MAQPEAQNGGGEAEKALSFKSLKPQLFVEAPKANDAVIFYKAAFGAEEVNRTLHPKRKAEQEAPAILSAELSLSDFSFLVSDVFDDSDTAEKKAVESRVALFLETEDIDSALIKAMSAGALVESDIAEGEGPYGSRRVVQLKDPFGFVWLIAAQKAKETAVVEA